MVGDTIAESHRWENTLIHGAAGTEKISTFFGILCPIGSRNLYLY